MGTRSTIGLVNSNGGVTGIYCHWDGYPEHNGRILRDSYKTIAKINKLMKLGDLSSLGAEIGKKHDFMATNMHHQCTAYGRDRGETGIEAQLFTDENEFLQDNRGQDYTYLFKDGKWYCWEAYTYKLIDLYSMVDEEA
jgi:hypothetical protein